MDGHTRDVRVVGVPPATAEANGAVVSLLTGTQTAIHWAQIAVSNAHAARRARQGLADAQRRGSPLEFALAAELHASLIAISAAAHAVEALFAELKPLVVTADAAKRWKQNGTKRRGQIRETLRQGFRLVGEHWGRDFDWLFDLRNAALDPGLAAGDPHAGSHPLGIGAAPEFCEFTSEQAERAARLVVDVFRTCAAYPWPATRAWADRMEPVVEKLCADLDGALS